MLYNQEGHDEYPMEEYYAFQDKFVKQVVDKYTDRSKVGIEKYGTTLERDDVELVGWLNHLQEELMDATLYIQKLKEELNNEQY